jgi:hypothetical protein
MLAPYSGAHVSTANFGHIAFMSMPGAPEHQLARHWQVSIARLHLSTRSMYSQRRLDDLKRGQAVSRSRMW